MFNLTGSEIVVILLLALIVLGPEKLPEAVRRFGRTYAELKKMSAGFQSEFKAAIEEPVREMRDTAEMLGRSMDFSGDPLGDTRVQDPPSEPSVTDPVQPAEEATARRDDVPDDVADGAPDDPPGASDPT